LPLSTYSAPGGLRQDPGRAAQSSAEARTCGNGGYEVRVVLSAWGSRGDVEPLAGLAVRLRELGAEVRVCAPPDEEFAALLAGVGVPLVPFGPAVRALVTGVKAPSVGDAFRLAAELVAARFDTLAAAVEGCDALVATGLMPAGARSVAEKLGIRYVYACLHPFELPSPHYPPQPRPGKPSPQEETDNKVLWEQDAQRVNALYGEALNRHRAAIGLPPVDNVRDHVFTDQPWLAADPTLCPWQDTTDLDVVQTGAWILPDERLLPQELEAFLDAGAPPVYVGFGSMAMRASTDLARVAIEAIRVHGRRVLLARGWADLDLIDDQDDCLVVGEVNQQALFGRVAAVVHHGGAGTTTTAARAGAAQVVVPQIVDQPYWAARVAELGIGAAHDGPTPTFDSLSAALTTALTPKTRARARAVAGTIRTDGATVAARLLLDTGQPPVSLKVAPQRHSLGRPAAPTRQRVTQGAVGSQADNDRRSTPSSVSAARSGRARRATRPAQAAISESGSHSGSPPRSKPTAARTSPPAR
jgi:vancomycin aglycone glucosyltransferase